MKKVTTIGISLVLTLSLVIPQAVDAASVNEVLRKLIEALRADNGAELVRPDNRTQLRRSINQEVSLADAFTPRTCNLQLSNRLYRGATDRITNGEVSLVQQFLSDHGYYPAGLITGYYGTLTEDAVKRFQTQNGIAAADNVGAAGYGVVDERTRNKIASLCSSAGADNVALSTGSSLQSGSRPSLSSASPVLTTNGPISSSSAEEVPSPALFTDFTISVSTPTQGQQIYTSLVYVSGYGYGEPVSVTANGVKARIRRLSNNTVLPSAMRVRPTFSFVASGVPIWPLDTFAPGGNNGAIRVEAIGGPLDSDAYDEAYQTIERIIEVQMVGDDPRPDHTPSDNI